ncbi:hypothetical protein GE061_013245 [Apolygus lucorum]|uniref:Retrotransposon gag domain-containing protein n=1 Tax=Apolygus lucorum TaxID=248454 RepID=A0A8S9XVZ2_APOLU|nr:hypothetical protein GE061_013245 [Apolygus lucorum]
MAGNRSKDVAESRGEFQIPVSSSIAQKPYLKVKNFDGSVNWDAYLVQFEDISERNGWDESMKMSALESALTGPALDILIEIVPPRTYQKLKDTLEKRFGSRQHAQRYMTQLVSRVQFCKESVSEYHLQFRTLAQKAWPGVSMTSELEELVVYHFMNGLRDATLRDRVMGLWPKTLNEVLEVALRFETIALTKTAPARIRKG